MDLRILHQPLWSIYASLEDCARGLGRAVRCADGGEDDGACAAHCAEEALVVLGLLIALEVLTYRVDGAEMLGCCVVLCCVLCGVSGGDLPAVIVDFEGVHFGRGELS